MGERSRRGRVIYLIGRNMSMFASGVTEMGEERYRRSRVIKSKNKVKICQCLQALCQKW
jgi:hypothetical protein